MNLALMLASLSIGVGLSEIGLRLFCAESLRIIQDDRSLLYRYDETLGWFPIANSSKVFFASRAIRVVHDSEGFRGPERSRNNKPGVLFLGDSFVWGYDVEAPERFTDKLQAKHPAWNVYNLGISGYGTDQELLLLERHFREYKPRVVFLVYCAETDEDDNRSNVRYGGYYKPYCIVAGDRLEMRGIPVPKSERVFLAEHEKLSRSLLVRLAARGYFKLTAPKVLRNPSPTWAILRTMQKYVTGQGALFVMGLTRSTPEMEEFLRRHGIPFVDLSTPLRYPSYGNHWTPEGHTFVCEQIEGMLVKGKYLEGGAALP